MPTYEYACTTCGHHLEVSQAFSDEPLTACPSCGGPLRKVFGSIGIVLKGSGFYRTDSRSSNAGSAPKKEKDTEKERPTAASSGDSGSTPKKETAPSSPDSTAKAGAPSSSAASA